MPERCAGAVSSGADLSWPASGTHSAVRLAVVPLSGEISGAACAPPLLTYAITRRTVHTPRQEGTGGTENHPTTNFVVAATVDVVQY
jgi:hypothetical protein